MQEGQFEFDTSYRNNLPVVIDSLFFQKIINSLIESWGGYAWRALTIKQKFNMFFGAREFHSEGKTGREEFAMSAMLLIIIMVPQLLVLIVLNNTSSSKV